MRIIGGRTALMLMTWAAVLLITGPMAARAEDPAQRNPFMSTTQSAAPSQFALAADLVRLHGLVTVGGESRAILSCPADGSGRLAYHLVGNGRTVRVGLNTMNYSYRVRLHADGVVLTGTNKETYKLEL